MTLELTIKRVHLKCLNLSKLIRTYKLISKNDTHSVDAFVHFIPGICQYN